MYLMTVSLNQWCGVSMVSLIAEYNSPSKFKIHTISLTGSFVYFFTISLLHCVYISLLTLLYIFSFLACSGDIEAKSGPQKFKQNSHWICHWNFNSLSVHGFANLKHLKANNSTYEHNFICLSKTCLHSTTHNNLLEIKSFNLAHADPINNVKR